MSDPTLQQIARTLKEIASTLKDQNRILKAMSSTSTEKSPESGPVEVPPLKEEEEPRRVFGWSMAASVQREGGLKAGDIKHEQDESIWIWTGEIWERVEAPSGN